MPRKLFYCRNAISAVCGNSDIREGDYEYLRAVRSCHSNLRRNSRRHVSEVAGRCVDATWGLRGSCDWSCALLRGYRIERSFVSRKERDIFQETQQSGMAGFDVRRTSAHARACGHDGFVCTRSGQAIAFMMRGKANNVRNEGPEFIVPLNSE